MQTHRFVALLALLSLACDPVNPCSVGRYDPGPPRACVLDDGGRVLLDDGGPIDAAMLDAGPPSDTGACVARVETCDGTDEDCDGNFDETFGCARGGSTECTTTCGTTGTGTCSATCGAPAADECTPPAETCNGVDDDCDGVADDGVLEWGTPVEWSGVEQPMSWAQIGDRWLVVYESGRELVGQWIDAEGRLDGAPSPPLLPGTSVLRASVAAGSDTDRVLVAYTQLSGTALQAVELSATTWTA